MKRRVVAPPGGHGMGRGRPPDGPDNIRAFHSAVDDVPDDTKVPDAVDSLRSEAGDFGTTVTELESELKC